MLSPDLARDNDPNELDDVRRRLPLRSPSWHRPALSAAEAVRAYHLAALSSTCAVRREESRVTLRVLGDELQGSGAGKLAAEVWIMARRVGEGLATIPDLIRYEDGLRDLAASCEDTEPGVGGKREGGAASAYPKKDLVCFAAAFAYETAPNITHMTLDGERTACGRRGWMTSEGWHSNGPDCLRCRKAFERLPEPEKRNTWEAS